MAVRTINSGDTRFYFTEDLPERRYPGVTSIIDMLPKKFLQRWNAKMSAELAIDSLDFIKEMAERDPEGAKAYIAGAAYRYTKRRSTLGSEAHDLFERLLRGEYVGRVHTDLEPYKRHFSEFLEVVQPELVRAEDVAWSDEHQYAGSFDGWLRLHLDEHGKPDPHGESALVVGDWKTGKNIYPSVALQLSAYAHAEWVIDQSGNRDRMPDFDGGAVLHVTPEGWEFIPVRIDREVFDHFLMLRHTFEWERRVQKTVIGDPIAAKTTKIVTGTQRRK
ncbi:hypothetical protein [Allostreptomyces psammosilenae]|uniref:PD-(D/E)XK endonuclease-like domain-containing protein n=1 Tax=Allostreptomyces psammosilenae TaxID=1892865 RepID=A0A853A5W6_9ACTN|nr:hypothetical protein [Allostreptomyces psammosilenae]NYI06081.1 hypothetical protein [Allostreptomyces psammosilenae]